MTKPPKTYRVPGIDSFFKVKSVRRMHMMHGVNLFVTKGNSETITCSKLEQEFPNSEALFSLIECYRTKFGLLFCIVYNCIGLTHVSES